MRLRERLVQSLDYLAGFLTSPGWDQRAAVQVAAARLKQGPVSPWVFGFYALLVQRASKGELDAARFEFEGLLDATMAGPPPAFVPVGDPVLTPAHWTVARVLFDTDSQRPFLPVSPSDPDTVASVSEIASALTLLDRASPAFAAEVKLLLRTILLGVPAGPTKLEQFNGASTFFLWGATILNAAIRRGVIGMIDLLVHESSHLLLFGLVGGNALSTNDPQARYTSPLRHDPRPIDGIFHAAFVSTRVTIALVALRDCGLVAPDDLEDLAYYIARNRGAAERGMDLLTRELQPTPAGSEVFDALTAYWQGADTVPARPALSTAKLGAILLLAVTAAENGIEPTPVRIAAIRSGGDGIRMADLDYDSLGWMEFCISVELQTGAELTPDLLGQFDTLADAAAWIAARAKA